MAWSWTVFFGHIRLAFFQQSLQEQSSSQRGVLGPQSKSQHVNSANADIQQLMAERRTLQDPPMELQSGANLSGFFKLPLEIRQQILSYLVDPQDPTSEHFALNLTHRQATTISHVSRQLRADVSYLHSEWRKTQTCMTRSVRYGTTWTRETLTNYKR